MPIRTAARSWRWGGRVGRRLRCRLVPEQHVVASVAVERRVEVDQIDRLVWDVLAQDGEIVAIE
jgi:hypothetical protein